MRSPRAAPTAGGSAHLMSEQEACTYEHIESPPARPAPRPARPRPPPRRAAAATPPRSAAAAALADPRRAGPARVRPGAGRLVAWAAPLAGPGPRWPGDVSPGDCPRTRGRPGRPRLLPRVAAGGPRRARSG